MQVFKIVNLWIHLLSGFFWIGGIFFFSIVCLPAVRRGLPKEIGGTCLRDLWVRFQKVASIPVTLLLITGGINIHFSHQARGIFSTNYFHALSFKILFFTIILTMYLLNLKNLQEIQKSPTFDRPPLQDSLLVLGVLILLMASFLKHTP